MFSFHHLANLLSGESRGMMNLSSNTDTIRTNTQIRNTVIIVYVFKLIRKDKNKLWHSQQKGGFVSNNFYLVIGWIMRFTIKRGDLYKKYKAGWSLLFHHSVRPLLDWLPIQWYKGTKNKFNYQTKSSIYLLTYGKERTNPQSKKRYWPNCQVIKEEV